MKWFTDYRARVLGSMYEREPFGPNQLTMLWPLLAGGALFAAIDIGVGLANPYRLLILAALMTPATIWLGYLSFHMLRSLRRWIAQRDRRE